MKGSIIIIAVTAGLTSLLAFTVLNSSSSSQSEEQQTEHTTGTYPPTRVDPPMDALAPMINMDRQNEHVLDGNFISCVNTQDANGTIVCYER